MEGDGVSPPVIMTSLDGASRGKTGPDDDAEVNKTPGAEQHIFMLFHPSKARLGKVRAMVDFLMAELGEPELRVT